MFEEDARVLVVIGRNDNAAVKAVVEKQVQNGGRVMIINVNEDTRLSADFIDTVLEWNPPLAGHTHHWYQIGPGIHNVTEREAVRICSNGVMICDEVAFPKFRQGSGFMSPTI